MAEAEPAPPFPRFVPGSTGGPLYRGLVFVLRSAWVRSAGMAFARRCDRFFKALIAGPLGPHLPIPFLVLSCVGARSGAVRVVALLYFSDGDDLVLIGSNFGGARNPAWVHNLRADPAVGVRRGRFTASCVASEVVDADEHERLYAMAEAVYPGYAAYRRQTAAHGRRIPIMRLRIAASS